MTDFQNQFNTLLDYWPEEDQSLRNLRYQAFEKFNELGSLQKNGKNGNLLIFLHLKNLITVYLGLMIYPNYPEKFRDKFRTHISFL